MTHYLNTQLWQFDIIYLTNLTPIINIFILIKTLFTNQYSPPITMLYSFQQEPLQYSPPITMLYSFKQEPLKSPKFSPKHRTIWYSPVNSCWHWTYNDDWAEQLSVIQISILIDFTDRISKQKFNNLPHN